MFIEKPDSSKTSNVIPAEVFTKKLKEGAILKKEKPLKTGSRFENLVSIKEYKDEKARRWFLERYRLPANASLHDIANAIARESLGLAADASKEEIHKAELERMDEEFAELNRADMRKRNLLPPQG